MLPRHMPSPAAVLRWQAGDCFDMSMLLCSLLLGVGYDAYVVVGYAHKKVTLCDQTDKPVNDAGRSGAAELASGSGGNKYVIQRRQPLESKFDKDAKLEQEDAEAKARAKAQREAELEFGEDPEREEDMDELRGKRVHAWVLLLAGKRELPDNFFVEATTGVCYRLDAAAPPPYYGVESIFNASNYWTNMQPGALHAHDLAWDLHDTACWEHVFVDPPASAVLEGMAGLGLEDIEAADDDDDDLVDTSPPTPARAPSQTAGEAEEGARPAETAEAAEAAGGDGAVPVSRAQSAAAHAPPLDAGTADEQAPSEPAAIDPDTLLDMPPSWVRRLALTPAQLESRCPGREKEVAYKAGALQKWAPYARDDGLVARITLYSDLERTQAAEVHERFEQRKDRLALRVTKVDASVVLEEFLPGRPFGLKENELEAGVRRRMRFLPAARLDGLQMREEHFGRKTIETYVGRDDRLVYRSVTFDEASAASAALVAGAKDAEPAIVKMAEKYARNDELDAALDVAKRVYDVRAGSIHVTYHLGPGHITAPSRTFFKEAWPPAVTLTDPFAKRPADAALREEYQALVTAERECLQVRAAALRCAAAASLRRGGACGARRGVSDAECPGCRVRFGPCPSLPLLAIARARAHALHGRSPLPPPRLPARSLGAALCPVRAGSTRRQAFREQERQMKEILKRREAEEAAHELLFSVYDTARQRHYLDAERKDDAATAAVMHDYLTPFLPNPKSTEPLDREAALKVREACLKSLRVSSEPQLQPRLRTIPSPRCRSALAADAAPSLTVCPPPPLPFPLPLLLLTSRRIGSSSARRSSNRASTRRTPTSPRRRRPSRATATTRTSRRRRSTSATARPPCSASRSSTSG